MKKTTVIVAGLVLSALSSATALASADAAPLAHGATARAAHSYVVDAQVERTDPILGDKVKIDASVTPATAGATVSLQVKYEGQKKWKTIDHARLNGRGKVTFKDKIGSTRARKYRVVKPADSRGTAGSGETRKVLVYSWYNLTGLDPVTASTMGDVGSASINGKSYPYSVGSYCCSPGGGPALIEYNLTRRCHAFRATVGLLDSSATDASVQVQVLADGAQRWAGSFTLGQSSAVLLDVTGVFRLGLAASPPRGGLAGIGSPEVLCAF